MSVRTISGMQLATTIYVALPVSSRFITCVAARIDAKDQTCIIPIFGKRTPKYTDMTNYNYIVLRSDEKRKMHLKHLHKC